MIQTEYNIIDALAYFASAAIPVYFIIKSRRSINNPFRIMMFILAGFVLLQGAYHTMIAIGLNTLSKIYLEPVSGAILAAGAVRYYFMRKGLVKEANRLIGK